MTLSSTEHAAHLLTDLKRRLAGIDNTPMFPSDSIRSLKSLALSKLSYTLPLGMMQPHQLEELQKLFRCAIVAMRMTCPPVSPARSCSSQPALGAWNSPA